MIRHEWKAYLAYTLVSLLVMLPLLRPGFILTLDLVFTPALPMPDAITSSLLFHASLHVLSLIVPSEIIEKILLLGILLLATIGMHRLIRSIQTQRPVDWGIYAASVFFALNPFTYSRFMAGQFAVLLGYALLPWLVRLMINFAKQPGAKTALVLGAFVALIGVVSIHTLVAVAILAVAGIGFAVYRRDLRQKYLRYGLVALGFFVLLSSYWLFPLLAGQGTTAAAIASFTAADTQAFATVGQSVFDKIFALIHLQGFWAEARNLYLLPQDYNRLCQPCMLVILALILVGTIRYWQQGRHKIVLWLGCSGLAGIVLATGVLDRLIGTIPLLQGLREPHKMLMLVALFYSLVLAVGVNEILRLIRQKAVRFYAAALVIVLALPFAAMRVMLWGFDGQLVPRHYPNDWFAANDVLGKDPAGRILFLPWHQYMSFQFAGRIIATPAPAFFGPRVIVSRDPEFGGSTSGQPNDSRQALALALRARQGSLDTALSGQDIRFVLLAKDFDYQSYDFLKQEPQLQLLADYTTLILYENKAWRQQ